MFDAEYFRTTLPRDVEAMGGDPVVEVQLVSGHTHRVRAVVETASGFVTLEAFLGKGDLSHEKPRFGGSDPSSQQDTFRAVVSYESIVAVIVDPSRPRAKATPGFFNS
jgi:hypothetical protein